MASRPKTGAEIKALARIGANITPTRSARETMTYLIHKYGVIEDDAKYIHYGHGWWCKIGAKRGVKHTPQGTLDTITKGAINL